MNKQQLFTAHSQDLRAICPNTLDQFVCPICFRLFELADLDKPNTLTIGHVWPRHYFRTRSKASAKQTVLLCFNCNSSGGHTFDAAMQKYERSRILESIGEAPDRRLVTVISDKDRFDRRVKMPLFVLESKQRLTREQSRTVSKNAGIHFHVRARGEEFDLGLYPLIDHRGRKHYNEQEWAKAIEVMTTERFSLIIEPYDSDWTRGKHSDIPHLWQAGMLTSAYLYAFYTFGYRYIFQTSLDPVREYICQAFQRRVDSRLNFEPTKTMTVAHSPDFFEDPTIGFFNPTDTSKETYHLRVHFRDHAIWLPLQYTYTLKTDEINNTEACGITMSAPGHKPHPGKLCQWDMLFGRPDYHIENYQVVQRSEHN